MVKNLRAVAFAASPGALPRFLSWLGRKFQYRSVGYTSALARLAEDERPGRVPTVLYPQPLVRVRKALDDEGVAGRFGGLAGRAPEDLALGARVIVFQCPASFAPTEENKERLGRFFEGIERGVRLCLGAEGEVAPGGGAEPV